MPTDDILLDCEEHMEKAVEHLRHELRAIRTGRASPAQIEHLMVEYYGTPTPLKNIATINVPEPRLLTIQPFDPSSVKTIEKSIQESDLGLQPSNDGKLIRLPVPQLTEERRRELVKVVGHMAEEHRIAIRDVRRDAMKNLQDLVKKGDVGEDDERRAEQEVQKLTDAHTKTIDELLKHKEAEIMEV
jgi:ribosome recycling factor